MIPIGKKPRTPTLPVTATHLVQKIRQLNSKHDINGGDPYALTYQRQPNPRRGYLYRVVMLTHGNPMGITKWTTPKHCIAELASVNWPAMFAAARGVTK